MMMRLDVMALYWTEEYAVAAAVLDRLIEHGRRTRHRLLAGWIDTRAAIDFRLGRWSASEARCCRSTPARGGSGADDAGRLVSDDVGPGRRVREGKPRSAGGGSTRQRRSQAPDEGLQFGWARSAAGLLELGLGRVDEAIETLEPLVRSSVGQVANDQSIALATCDLIEAYVRAGRSADAQQLCERFEPRAVSLGQVLGDRGASPLSRPARACRGLRLRVQRRRCDATD